jgi:vacuole morphology and inheritance protein 14
MMIVDLQGVGNVLTDPQIHCLDKQRFGKGNLGYEGMLMFFNTHQCN